MSRKIPYTFENSNLFYAAETGQLVLAREFLDKEADPDYAELGRTTLAASVLGDHVEIARLLLERGASPNLKSEDGLTPLMQTKSGEMIKLLAEYGADPKACDDDGHNALVYLALYNCHDAVKAWLELKWPTKSRKTKLLMDRLLTRLQFDMVTLLTGLEFRADNPLARIAEFKARWAI